MAERLRIVVPLGAVIHLINVIGVFFLIRAVHRFASLRRPAAEAVASILFVLAGAFLYFPSGVPGMVKSLSTWAALCGVGSYGIATLVQVRPENREAAAERFVGIALFGLLIATAGADYFLEASPLHPLTADHFAFAAWHALVLGLSIRRSAERRNRGGSAEARVETLTEAYKLSPRERAALEGVLRGWSNKRIALELSIEETTVKTYVSSLFRKCGAASRFELMAKFR